MVMIAALVLFAVFGCLSLFSAGLGIWRAGEYVRGRAAARWPTTTGTVTATRIEETKTYRGGFRYTPVVRYRYAVAGAEYDGNRLAFGDDAGDGSHSGAERVLQSYPVCTAVLVHYNSGRPGESVLQMGPDAWWLFDPVGWAVGFLLLAGYWFYLCYQLWLFLSR
jgi:hypothetical protein